MDKQIKTAQAWGWLRADGTLRDCWVAATHPDGEPVHFCGVIVHGLTEAEIHEAAALLAKSREAKCHWHEISDGAETLKHFESCDGDYVDLQAPQFCPLCGRRVEVKE